MQNWTSGVLFQPLCIHGYLVYCDLLVISHLEPTSIPTSSLTCECDNPPNNGKMHQPQHPHITPPLIYCHCLLPSMLLQPRSTTTSLNKKLIPWSSSVLSEALCFYNFHCICHAIMAHLANYHHSQHKDSGTEAESDVGLIWSEGVFLFDICKMCFKKGSMTFMLAICGRSDARSRNKYAKKLAIILPEGIWKWILLNQWISHTIPFIRTQIWVCGHAFLKVYISLYTVCNPFRKS